MLVIAWSGSLAVFNDEIGWLATRELRADPAKGTATIDEVIASLQARFPERRFDVHLQSGPNWAHTAYVYESGRTLFVHVDPATATITRVDVMSGYTWNVVYFIRQLHVRLLMGFWGRVFVGIFGVTLVLSIVTSLWVYRDWLRSLVRIRRGSGRRIFPMDVHKMVGAWALAINLVFGVTGAVLGLENLYNRVMPRRAADRQAVPNDQIHLRPGLTHGAGAAALAAADPAFVPTVVQVNPATRMVGVRGDHPGALIAKDASFYRVDLESGRIVARSDARRAAWPAYLYNTLDPLHFGHFGDKWNDGVSYGIKVVWCLLGLTPGILGLTGGYMWLLRRRRVRAAAAARAAIMAVSGARPQVGGTSLGVWYVAGLLPFLGAGYALQAIIWDRGWGLSEVLWQHWIIKPVCLIVVAFPLTVGALLVGSAVLALAARRQSPGAAALAAAPIGALYVAATALFN